MFLHQLLPRVQMCFLTEFGPDPSSDLNAYSANTHTHARAQTDTLTLLFYKYRNRSTQRHCVNRNSTCEEQKYIRRETIRTYIAHVRREKQIGKKKKHFDVFALAIAPQN